MKPENYIIVSFEYNEDIKTLLQQGYVDLAVSFLQEKWGEYIIPAALSLINNQPIPEKIFTDIKLMTRENIDSADS